MNSHINLDRVNNPERLIQTYLHLTETRGAPGARLVDGQGRKYLKTCRAKRRDNKVCGSKDRMMSKNGYFICVRCGSTWRFYSRMLLKGSVQTSPRIGATDHRLATEATVGLLLDRFSNNEETYWHVRVYILKIVKEVGDEHLIRIGPKHIPGFPHPWTEYQMRKSIAIARKAWRERLTAAGIAFS